MRFKEIIMNSVRDESIIFAELSELCSRPGYAHVIGYFCFRDNTASIPEEIEPETIAELHRPEALIRTEISTLVGLLVKGDLNFNLPNPDDMQAMIDRTQELLAELHVSFLHPMRSHLENITSEQPDDPFSLGSVLREPIFYGGESAYDFQYLEFSKQKYANDNDWLRSNKGFSIDDAASVISGIVKIHQRNMLNHFDSLKSMHPDDWTFLPAYMFSVEDVAEEVSFDLEIIQHVLQAFCFTRQSSNDQFHSISDYNATNSVPLIQLDEGRYLLFQFYSLAESLYESPYYWMVADEEYRPKLSDNRGNYLEDFSAEKLRLIFGDSNVYMNLDIYDPKTPKKGRRGEIDVLVTFGDRAIILQAKSKRLTVEARKGNDQVIRKDFAASIQDAYDQGFLCADLLLNESNVLEDSNGNKVEMQKKFSEVYIFCVVSDHYPALSFQARQFLNWEHTDNIKPPFVMDVFNLDVMSEMLQSPLFFLSYVNRRTDYTDKIMSHHEITILSFFMQHNPWLEENNFIALDDSVSSNIDSAMMVRRLGLPGKAIPDGVISRLMGGHLGKILKSIGKSNDPAMIDFGLLVLSLGNDAIDKLEDGIDKILKRSKDTQKSSDLTVAIGKKESGITIHSNRRSVSEAMSHLQRHCEMRKYIHKAASWYGLCIDSYDGSPRLVIKGEYPWVHSKDMEDQVERNLLKAKSTSHSSKRKRNKIGVNEKCPCGSGVKYKKCCKRR